jgi:hypothetical protein
MHAAIHRNWAHFDAVSIVDPKLFFSDPDAILILIPNPNFFEKYIWTADHLNIAKKQIF